ncbi:hypothetical protein NDU88_006266 [Pleurodeles waltl]|uniref:Uncharacterized protein n=1 Tax=Pleurodeles waltl TaxID=8319 RepID=A0AAV7WX47_PLEWA|nr:hypothetical protein NDU88_006266 [Pleurodeles waltl]
MDLWRAHTGGDSPLQADPGGLGVLYKKAGRSQTQEFPPIPSVFLRPQHAPRANRGPGGNSHGRAPLSPSSSRLSPDQEARVSEQTGAAVPPGQAVRTAPLSWSFLLGPGPR